ncbi:Exonuclease family protein [Spironucleus salmonicida]|uniref:Exonuclease family protein n=1 Tax=Spironucleus salmonicida TaxID=348837 RepID=V6LGT0_9EUKA|nr:Exonuclease family protein [Spironucleus salmonicida]|eukprot:EST43750.1 Exonuclease family protein [Spironucleus salmonicida]
MGIKKLTGLLPQTPIPYGYFINKTIAIDFYNFAFISAPYTGYDLIVRDNVQSFYIFFNSLIKKIMKYRNAKVIICQDGQLLAGKAPVSLPRMQKREKIRKSITKNTKRKRAQKLTSKGFNITKLQCQKVFELLKKDFPEDRFSVICAPYEADFQIDYFVKSGMIDCVLSNDSDMPLLGVDVITHFGSKSQMLISKTDMEMFISKYGGMDSMFKCCLLMGNDYYPGHNKPMDDIYQQLLDNNFDLLKTAFALNQNNSRYSDGQLVKTLFLAYAIQYYPCIFDFSKKQITHLRQISKEDQEVFRTCFGKDIVGKESSDEKIIMQISGYALNSSKKIKSLQFFKNIFENSLKKMYRQPKQFNLTDFSILNILKCVKVEGTIYRYEDKQFDLSEPALYAHYLFQQSIQEQLQFNFNEKIPENYIHIDLSTEIDKESSME